MAHTVWKCEKSLKKAERNNLLFGNNFLVQLYSFRHLSTFFTTSTYKSDFKARLIFLILQIVSKFVVVLEVKCMEIYYSAKTTMPPMVAKTIVGPELE